MDRVAQRHLEVRSKGGDRRGQIDVPSVQRPRVLVGRRLVTVGAEPWRRDRLLDLVVELHDDRAYP